MWTTMGPEEAVVKIRTMLSAMSAATVVALWGAPAQAQSIGTFTWQLQPFCNKVTLSVTQNGGIYTLDGYDDQCGAAQRAPLVGLATPNPDGTIGLGLNIVTVPSGLPVHVDARISLGSLGGPWTDSAGNSGTLVLNGAAAGSARPAPTVSGTVLAVGSIPGTAIANGAVGTAQIANGAVGNAQIANNSVSSTQTSNEPGIASSYFNTPSVPVTPAAESIATVAMRVPANGFVKIEVSASAFQAVAGQGQCQLQKGAATTIDPAQPSFFIRNDTDGLARVFSAHRIVPVSVADNPLSILQGQVFRLVCASATAMNIRSVHLTATYYASEYAPLSLVILPDTPPQQ